jgi:uncharacterized protein (UPF0548 family)
MFLISRPTTNQIEHFLQEAATTLYSYAEVGASRQDSESIASYNIDHNQIVIGNNEDDFERAKQAVREWKMFDFPWVDLCWPEITIEEDRTVAILIQHLGFYSLNAARIVYTIDESDWFGFAYGTLEDHGESGEERFSVRLDRESGDVIYGLSAFSRPNHLLAHLAYPLTRMLQKSFAEDSKQAMLRAVRDNRLN